MINKNTKIAIYTNLPSPYKVKLFNFIGKQCRLTVFFEMKKSRQRDEGFENYNFNHFNGIFLKSSKHSKDGDSAYGKDIIKQYKKLKPDVNVVWNYSSRTGLKLLSYFILHKIKYCIAGDGAFPNESNGFLKRITKKIIFSKAAQLLYTSDPHKDYYEQYTNKYQKLYWYPFASVSLEHILKSPLSTEEKFDIRRKMNIDINKKLFISVGRFVDVKKIDQMIEVCGKYGDTINLMIIGGEPTKKYLDIITSNNLNNIIFKPFMNQDELFQYLKCSDCFIFSSVHDIWGLVINEAASNGLPIISSKGALASIEFAKNSNGVLLYDQNNLQQLQKTIDIFISYNEAQIQDLSKSNLEIAKKYSLESSANKLLDIFSKLV